LARLYVAWPKVRRAGTESAYVWRIIVNAHIDEVRRPSRRRERHVPELPELPAPPEAYPDGLGGSEVRAALGALPPGMRAAVVLRHWLDLSVGETAELMNCSARPPWKGPTRERPEGPARTGAERRSRPRYAG